MKNCCKEVEKTNKKVDEMNKSLKDTQENQDKAIKQVMETVQDLKNEMEVMKKTQTKGRLDMENLGNRSGTTETSITNRLQEIEERFSDAEDTIEEINSLIKKKQQIQQILNTKHPGNLGHHKKTKPKNNRGRRRRITVQRPRKYFNKNI